MQACRTWHISCETFLVLLLVVTFIYLFPSKNLKAEFCQIQMGEAEMLELSSNTVLYLISWSYGLVRQSCKEQGLGLHYPFRLEIFHDSKAEKVPETHTEQ